MQVKEDQQLLERQRALDSIHMLLLELLTAPALAAALHPILEQLIRLTGMQVAECYVREPVVGERRAAATDLADDERLDGLRMEAVRRLGAQVGEKAEPLIMADLRADANNALSELAAAGYGSLVFLPLDPPNGARVGSLVLYGMRACDFSPSEQVLLQTFARQIASGIAAAQTHRREQEQKGQLRHSKVIGVRLSQVAVRLQGAHTVHELLQTLNAQLQMMGMTSAVLLRDGGDSFRVQAFALKPSTTRAIQIASGMDADAIALPLFSQHWLPKTLMTGAPVLIRNVRQYATEFLGTVEPERLQRALWVAGLSPQTELALLPLSIKGDVQGVLMVWGPNVKQATVPSLGIFASHVAQLIVSIGLREQLETAQARLRELTREIINVQENERARISRQLHDEAGQSLTALKIQLFLLHKSVPPDQRYLIEALQHSMDDVGHLVQQMRSLSHEVHPPALDDLGLNAALDGCCQTFAQSHQLPINYRGAPVSRVSRETGITLYRFLQEALTNVTRYADATHVDVTLKRNGSALILGVRDDGRGFDVKRVRHGIGLRSIRERLELIDGEFQVESQEGKGTRLTARVPVDVDSETGEEEE